MLVGTLTLGAGGFVAALAFLVYLVWAAGPLDSAVLVSLPFTALGGYGLFQFVRAARRSAFRGRPWYLAGRAFRDSVHVWTSGNVAVRLALSGTVAASVAGAGLAPFVFASPIRQDLLVYDAGTSTIHRIDLSAGAASETNELLFEAARVLSLVNVPVAFESAGGRRVPRASLLVLTQGANGVQVMFAIPPGAAKQIPLASLNPALDAPKLTFGPGGELYAFDKVGDLYRVDRKTGTSSRIASTGLSLAAVTYVPELNVFVGVAGSRLVRIDGSGGVRDLAAQGISGLDVCSIVRAPEGNWLVGDRRSGQVVALDGRSGDLRGALRIEGQDVFQQPCALAIAPARRAKAPRSRGQRKGAEPRTSGKWPSCPSAAARRWQPRSRVAVANPSPEGPGRAEPWSTTAC